MLTRQSVAIFHVDVGGTWQFCENEIASSDPLDLSHQRLCKICFVALFKECSFFTLQEVLLWLFVPNFLHASSDLGLVCKGIIGI
jgi:hypothetical protein